MDDKHYAEANAQALLEEQRRVYRQDLFAGFALAGLLASGKFDMSEGDPFAYRFESNAGDLADRAGKIAEFMEANAANEDEERTSEAREDGERLYARALKRLEEQFDEDADLLADAFERHG